MNLKFNLPNEWLVCPETKTELTLEGNTLVSKNGIYTYNEKDKYWNMIPAELKLFNKTLWNAWEILQNNAMVPYELEPERNLGVGPRPDFIAFANFCNFQGIVIDIGVGPQKLPTHFEFTKNKNVQFIGIDPLVGKQPRDFNFIQGLGEYLPFKDNFFDQVLFVTTLDHFIDPVIALLEAKRVLKPEGEICIWLGEKDKNTPKPKESPDWYKKLEIPTGAEDPFHFKRFGLDEFFNYCKKAELTVKAEKIIEVDQWRKNCFFKLSK